MKTERNILIAFILNLGFSIFELFGGLYTNSISILSDSIHDLGDAISIGISYIMEKISKKKADNKYTYGYIRFSVLGGTITTIILFISSIIVIIGAIGRLIKPLDIDYSKMIVFAIIGVILNFIASTITKEGDSINQKAVNLHMLEDVLGWIIVLIGAIIMRFTNIKIIDPIMSIGVALFILINSLKNLKKILVIFLEKTPSNIDIEKIKKEILNIKEIQNIHHIHIWSIDGYNNYATMHIVTKSKDITKIKKEIKDILNEYNIIHTTIETEEIICSDKECKIHNHSNKHHHH